MPVSAFTSFLIILAVAVTTFGTRVFPFLVFPKGKEIPDVVKYLGRVLTLAGSHRHAGGVLLKVHNRMVRALRAAGSGGSGGDGPPACLETEQPA